MGHMKNQLRGWQEEFSFDMHNAIYLAIIFSLILASLSLMQISSASMWVVWSRGKPLHPAILMGTFSVITTTVGMFFWVMYYWHIQDSGETSTYYDVAARCLIVSSKTVMQVLFMIQAHGHSVCSAEIPWRQHFELVGGLLVFGGCSFMLEVWSDSEFWGTSTEYVYDTRSGICLVAFDCFLLWLYLSRCYDTL